MNNYPEIFGKLVLTDIKGLSEAFNSLELTDFQVAMKKAMTKEEQAAAEAEKAATKKVGGGGIGLAQPPRYGQGAQHRQP